MKINFHQLVSAVGSKKDKIAAGLLVLYAQAASAGDVQAFDKLYTQLTGWAQGSLGKSIAIIFLLVGLAVGLAKGSLYAAVVSIACGLTLMIAPSVIDSIFTVCWRHPRAFASRPALTIRLDFSFSMRTSSPWSSP